MTHSPRRRIVLARMGAVALAPLVATPALAADELPPTPRMTEGPFYPREAPPERDNDLTRVPGAAGIAAGTILDLGGRILDRRGRPVAGAAIEIWQCDAFGQYHLVGEPAASGDARFQGWGVDRADAEGRYRFRTIRPAPYPGRTPHIHFTVLVGERRVLTSQMFVEGEPGNERDFLYRGLGREARLVTMRLEGGGAALRGRLEIVLAT